jgi:hypothetical protein
LTIYFDPPLQYAELELKDDKDRAKYREKNCVDAYKNANRSDDFTNMMVVQMQGRILYQTFG